MEGMVGLLFLTAFTVPFEFNELWGVNGRLILIP
jgi:hypothetical protein